MEAGAHPRHIEGAGDMLINAVVYKFPRAQADEAAGLLTELANMSLTEPGCRRFDVSRSNSDPGTFVLYEEWNDAAALETHCSTEHFMRCGTNGIRRLAKSRTAYLCSPLDPNR